MNTQERKPTVVIDEKHFRVIIAPDGEGARTILEHRVADSSLGERQWKCLGFRSHEWLSIYQRESDSYPLRMAELLVDARGVRPSWDTGDRVDGGQVSGDETFAGPLW